MGNDFDRTGVMRQDVKHVFRSAYVYASSNKAVTKSSYFKIGSFYFVVGSISGSTNINLLKYVLLHIGPSFSPL